MPITSKIDNELSQLLKAQIVFKKNPETQGTLSIKTKTNSLAQYTTEKYIKRGLEDLHDLTLTAGERIILEKNPRLSDSFVKYFDKHKYLKPVIVKNKDGIQEIKATGSLVDLILLEFPLTSLVTEQVSAQQIGQESPDVNYLVEAFRRSQARADFIRYNDIPIYFGGFKDRYSDEWYALLVASLIGEFKERILGTNHLLTSMAFNLPCEAYLNDKMWIEDWDRHDIAPSLDVSAGWEGSRIDSSDDLITQTDDFKYLIDGWDMAKTMHRIYHHPESNFIIEWDRGVARDFGFNFVELEVIKKISK